MSDYTLELECGCINFCRCDDIQRRRQIKEQGFDTVGLRVSQEVYLCNICEAITLDYAKHKDWHAALASLT